MITKIIIVLAIVAASGIPMNVNASELTKSDIGRSPESVCIMYGDEPDMKNLCDWINICDDNPGDWINSTHIFCTGEAVRDIPYPPGGCPEGYHSEEDDESGLCYPNAEGCREGLIFTNDGKSCIYDDRGEGGYMYCKYRDEFQFHFGIVCVDNPKIN